VHYSEGDSRVPRSTRAKKSQKRKPNATDTYRKVLIEQRKEIMNLYEHDLRVGQEASDEGTEDIVDRANNSYNREFMFALSDSERGILLEIDDALQRLDNDKFGTCLNCSQSIPKARLRALPWARYCIDCQEQVEQGIVLEN
jgi:DnaK suppressor protein